MQEENQPKGKGMLHKRSSIAKANPKALKYLETKIIFRVLIC
jgi:hypothetical protein